jgi:hypothetical protein
MSNQMFAQQDSKNWSTAWTAPRQMPMRMAAPNTPAATTNTRAEESSPHAEPQKAEDWAGDCLFDWYNN